MRSDEEISVWIKRLAIGDGRSAVAIYFSQLVQLVRRRLGGVPRRAADEEDVAFCAMKSCVPGAQAGAIPQAARSSRSVKTFGHDRRP